MTSALWDTVLTLSLPAGLFPTVPKNVRPRRTRHTSASTRMQIVSSCCGNLLLFLLFFLLLLTDALFLFFSLIITGGGYQSAVYPRCRQGAFAPGTEIPDMKELQP